MVFAKHYLSVELFEDDLVDYNILKLYISNVNVPINLICVYYRSLGTDSDKFIKEIKEFN